MALSCLHRLSDNPPAILFEGATPSAQLTAEFLLLFAGLALLFDVGLCDVAFSWCNNMQQCYFLGMLLVTLD